MKRILMLFVAVLLASLYSSAQQADAKAQVENVNAPVAQSQQTATIIFYRPGAFYGKALKPSIYVDGQEIGRLKSGKYIAYQTTPGKHMLGSSKKDAAVEVTASHDEPQYVEMLIQSGTWRGAGRLIPVPADEGKQKADKLKSQAD